MDLYIKNMVCDRCITAVNNVLTRMDLHPVSVSLGEATLSEASLTTEKLEQLRHSLETIGFELLDDRKSRILEKIRSTIIRLVHHSDELPRLKYSEIIASETGMDYPYLSRFFSESEGMTIEQYILRQKVERVKEFIGYNELTLSEIAERMGYSSVAHLSSQFRKVTGTTPSQYKKSGTKMLRSALDRVGE